MSGELAIWPLLIFACVLTAIAGGIFVAIFVSARAEEREQQSKKDAS
jgi:flagellar basal body-associated protein FliL